MQQFLFGRSPQQMDARSLDTRQFYVQPLRYGYVGQAVDEGVRGGEQSLQDGVISLH